MGEKKSWEELMVETQKGNSQMYNLLLTEVSSYLQPYLRSKLRNDEATQDVLQDVLISLHKARHTYEAQYPLKPWLFKIVQSRLIDHFRKIKRSSTFLNLNGDEDLATLTAEMEISQIEVNEFNSAIAALTEDQKSILISLKIDGKSIKDISRELSLSESAVKIIAHRAYKTLFKELGVDK